MINKLNLVTFKQTVTEIFQILVGIILASIGLKAFLLPNGFLDGGVTGVSILLNQLINVEVSYILIVASIPFLVLAWKTLTKKNVVKSFLAILTLAIFIHFENFSAITEDKLLIAIFGGLFLGAGIGLTIKNGAVLDGTEILGIYIHNRFGLSIGKVILVFNIILFAITAFVISLEVSMYSTLTFIVTAKVIDLVIQGFENYVGLMIVSEHNSIIERKLINDIKVGVTIYNNVKGYGQRGVADHSNVIYTVINRIDINRTYNLIETIDHQAFIIEFDINNVRGGIVKKYLSK